MKDPGPRRPARVLPQGASSSGCGALDGAPGTPGLQPDRELREQGWERRFLTASDRLEECVGLYEEMGFEVQVQTLEPSSFSEGCGACSVSVCATHVMIYTRKRGGGA